MSSQDECARTAFNEAPVSPRPSGKRERPRRDPPSSGRSGVVRSRRPRVETQEMAQLQENYGVVVGGFKILEAELLQVRERLAAAEAKSYPYTSQIESLTAELATCKENLAISEMRNANVLERLREVVVCQICHSIPINPYSTDCRHLYCASCLLDWWRTCEKPTCHTCHQTCLYPPARDCVHGLLVLAHEDSGEGTWVAFEGDDSLFRPFFPPVSQTFSTHNNRGHNEQGLEGSIQQESVVEVESALTAGGEGNWEKQVVVDEDESSV